MASNMGGKEGKRARRTSFLETVVQREGVLDSSKFKELVPPSVVLNAGRHSQSLGRRSSSNFPALTTPMGGGQAKKMGRIPEAGTSRMSSIPRAARPNSTLRKTQIPSFNTTTTTKVNETPSTGRTYDMRASVLLAESVTKRGILKKGSTGLSFGSRSTMRKSLSSESLYSVASGVTPMPTRIMSVGRKSPGMNRNWSSSQDSLHTVNPGITKILKPPKPDKAAQAPIIKYIVSFLKNHNYGKDFTAASFAMITTNEFYGICKFILKFLLGPSFFGVKDDAIVKIIEASILIKYPLTLKASQLKTPTVQSSWSSNITFLAWLCNRVEIINEPPAKNDIAYITRNKDHVIAESLMKSLKNLYFETFAPMRPFDEALQMEQNEFINDIAFEIQPPTEMSVEEMQVQIQEKKRKLEELHQMPDPRLEIMAKTKDTQERIAAARQKKAEMLEQIRRLTDKTGQISKKNLIEKKIQGVGEDIKYYQKKLAAQTITSDEAKRQKEETLKLKRECDSIEDLINTLQVRYEKKQTGLTNLQMRYNQLFKSFAVVEDYNDKIRQLNLKQIIPVNPFNVKELQVWLVNAKKTLRSTMKHVERMKSDIGLEKEKVERELRKGRDLFDLRSEELKAIQSSIQQVQQDANSRLEQVDFEHDEFDAEIFQAENQLVAIKAEIDAIRMEYEKLLKEKQSADTELEEQQKIEDEWVKQRDREFTNSLIQRSEQFHIQLMMQVVLKKRKEELEEEEQRAMTNNNRRN